MAYTEDKFVSVNLDEWRRNREENERKCDELRNSVNTDDTICVLVARDNTGAFKSEVMSVREMRERGIWDGKTRSPDYSARRAKGHLVPCRILDNAPRLPHFCGPMFDGLEHPLRYESQEAYDLLSM